MKTFRENIWNEGEYSYEAAYGFTPNLMAYLHDEDASEGAETEDGADSGIRASGTENADSESADAAGEGAKAKGRPCMIVIPGGGYCMVVPPEGECVAKEFFSRGMNCFVLTYTTDITFSIPLQKQPLYDISRAVRYVRKNAARFGVDPEKLLICGFSAGGHLVGSLAVHYRDVVDPDPELESISNRPDGVILGYPVITSGEYTHEYSIQALLGEKPGAGSEDYDAARQYFSLEKHVTSDTPPCFIWQTVEDDVVPVENSMMFAEACRKAKVPYAYYAFPHGWHGLSMHHSDAWRRGEFGEEYTMEQVFKAVDAVREGRGVRVSEKRRAEMIEQFSHPMEMPEGELPLFADVALWPDLAEAWMEKLW